MAIIIERRGSCNQCGWCCQGCRHLEPPFEGTKPEHYKCAIHDSLGEHCEICNQTHAGCMTYPDSPVRFENPQCGYRFYEKEYGAEILWIKQVDWDFIHAHGT